MDDMSRLKTKLCNSYLVLRSVALREVRPRTKPMHSSIGYLKLLLGKYGIELSLAIPPLVSEISSDGGQGHCWGRNDEFCAVASLRLVSPGAVTDGVTLFFVKK